MQKIKSTLIILGITALILALAAVFYLGKQNGAREAEKRTEQNLKPLLNLAFPEPASELYHISGVVKGIFGATINLEIDDPEDYLPHADGSPRNKILRFVSVGQETKIVLVDSTRLDANGEPRLSPLELSALKIGDSVTVWSKTDIRSTERVDATRIELLKY